MSLEAASPDRRDPHHAAPATRARRPDRRRLRRRAAPAFSRALTTRSTTSRPVHADDSGDTAPTTPATAVRPEISASAAPRGVDPALVRAIVARVGLHERHQSAGAQGLMQLMPRRRAASA
jgi:soluble lytic murein transglycosylase-like protein